MIVSVLSTSTGSAFLLPLEYQKIARLRFMNRKRANLWRDLWHNCPFQIDNSLVSSIYTVFATRHDQLFLWLVVVSKTTTEISINFIRWLFCDVTISFHLFMSLLNTGEKTRFNQTRAVLLCCNCSRRKNGKLLQYCIAYMPRNSLCTHTIISFHSWIVQ